MFVYGCPSLGVCVLYVLCVLCVCVYTACIVCMVCVYTCVCTHVVWVWEMNFTAVSRDVYGAFEAHSDPPEAILSLSLAVHWLAHLPHILPGMFSTHSLSTCHSDVSVAFLQPLFSSGLDNSSLSYLHSLLPPPLQTSVKHYLKDSILFIQSSNFPPGSLTLIWFSWLHLALSDTYTQCFISLSSQQSINSLGEGLLGLSST